MKKIKLNQVRDFLTFLMVLFIPLISHASDKLGMSSIQEFVSDSSNTGRALQLLFLVTLLSLAPSILIMVTSFVRISIVFSFVRNALGLQQTPPNQVLISLALFLTFFIMAPAIEKSYNEGIEPWLSEKLTEEEAFPLIIAPFKKFMVANSREKDIELFIGIGKITKSTATEDLPLYVLTPAFMISELKRAFEIGFLIFLPFLIIDILVASILMSMGMMMMPPVMIALPFKVIFFVVIDGWYLLTGSLIKSFIT